MAAKCIEKKANSKTKDVYALVDNGDATFTVFKLCSNYDGRVRGGIRKTWRWVGAQQRLTETDARKLYIRLTNKSRMSLDCRPTLTYKRHTNHARDTMAKRKHPIPGSRNFVQEANIARIERDDAQRKAASVMLAALEAAADHVGVVRLQTGFDVRPIQEQVRAAIAAARAAGITPTAS